MAEKEDGQHDCLAAAGGRTTHIRMSGAAHGFVRPPPRLTVKTATTAATASAGGPAGLIRHGFVPTDRPAPRTAARDDDNNKDNRIGTKEQQRRWPLVTQEQQDEWAAGGGRPVTQSSMIAGWRATTKRAVDKSNQQPTIARSGQRKGEGQCRQRGRAKRRRIATTMRKRIAPLPPSLPPLLLLPLPPPQAPTPAPPLLPLIKQ